MPLKFNLSATWNRHQASGYPWSGGLKLEDHAWCFLGWGSCGYPPTFWWSRLLPFAIPEASLSPHLLYCSS